MSPIKHALCLLALFAVLSEISGARIDQSHLRQNDQDDTQVDDAAVPYENGSETLDDQIYASRKHGWNGWTTCDWRAGPQFSCNDCNTRVICKPVGGILINCGGSTPYCRNGFCSIVPSDECTTKEEEVLEPVEEVDETETPEEVGNVEPVDEESSEGETADEVVEGGDVNEEDNTDSVNEQDGISDPEGEVSEVVPVEEVNEVEPVEVDTDQTEEGGAVEEESNDTQAIDEEVVEEETA